MEHDPKQLRLVLEQAAPPDLELAFRPMFGGIMDYADGKPFASLSNVGLALKLFGSDHADMLKIEGAEVLQYKPDQPPSKSYVVVPVSMLPDRNNLRSWIARSARNLKPAKQRAARSAE